jgi:hypothetical protein
MKRRVFWTILAAGFCLVPASVFAQRTLITRVRVNLRSGPSRTSPVKRVLPRHSELTWDEAMADREGYLHVALAAAPGDSGWVHGEYLVDRGLSAGQHASCGVLRWPVKTMGDADAGAVVRTPKASTIATMRAFPAPKVRPQNGRANAIEETEFGVSGNVIKWGLEPDSDLHLVLAEPNDPTQTIVLEVPDTTCVAAATKDVRDSIGIVRQEVVRALGPPPIGITALSAPVPVTVTGVGFFDFGHSTGHPPNAFELHPLLSIHFVPRSKPLAAINGTGPRGGVR